MSHFTDEQLATPLNEGCFALTDLDRGGRAILFSSKQRWRYDRSDRNALLQWFWYLLESSLEQESVQKNGFVALIYDDGPFSAQEFDRKIPARSSKMVRECLPIRCAAVHFMFDSKVFEYVLPIMMFMMGKRLRQRLRLYPGTRKGKRFQQLDEVGLAKELLPKIMGGESDFNVADWIEDRRLRGL